MIETDDLRATLRRRERYAPDLLAVRARVVAGPTPAMARDALRPSRRADRRWGLVALAPAAVLVLLAVIAVLHPGSAGPTAGGSHGFVGIRWRLVATSENGRAVQLHLTPRPDGSSYGDAYLQLSPDGESEMSATGCYLQKGRWEPAAAGFMLTQQRRITMYCSMTRETAVLKPGELLAGLVGPVSAHVVGSTLSVHLGSTELTFTDAGPGVQTPPADPAGASTSAYFPRSTPSG